MRKKTIPLQDRIFVFTSDVKKEPTDPISTNIGITINGEKSQIDLASLFHPNREIENVTEKRIRGFSLLDIFCRQVNDGIEIENISIGFYDKTTLEEVILKEKKTPLFQMSDHYVDEEAKDNFIELIKLEHTANLKAAELAALEAEKFPPESGEYVSLSEMLSSKGWSEFKNGNFRLWSKNRDNQCFLITKEGHKEIELEEDPSGALSFTLSGSRAKVTLEGDVLKITPVK